MTGAFLVDAPPTKNIFGGLAEEFATVCGVDLPSSCASLVLPERTRKIRVTPNRHAEPETVTAAVQHFEESIAGRPYLIEVVATPDSRWRAQIVRLPGIPTAMMPFYGTTPDEAVRHLCEWLTRAHARAAALPSAV